MKRTELFVILVVVMMLSAACGASTPAPAPQAAATQSPATQAPAPTAAVVQPTAAPQLIAAPTQALEPTTAPPTAVVTATNAPLPDSMLKLVGTTWQWTKSTDGSGKETKVNQPDKYTLQFFSADGKVAVMADCNKAAGSFTADGHNLTLSLDPLTLAACPAGSLSDRFIKELGEVQSYLFEGNHLIVGWRMDSGSMRFAKAGSAASAPAATAKPRVTSTAKPVVPTMPAKPATTLDFIADLVGCRDAPTAEKPGGIVLLFRFEPTGAAGPYRYFDVDAGKEVTELYERPASKGSGVIVTWAVQSADGQRREKKSDYAASLFAKFGCK